MIRSQWITSHCSFDVVRDQLGLVRSEFPHTLYGVAGTQVLLLFMPSKHCYWQNLTSFLSQSFLKNNPEILYCCTYFSVFLFLIEIYRKYYGNMPWYCLFIFMFLLICFLFKQCAFTDSKLKKGNVPETYCEHSHAFNIMILARDCNWLLVIEFGVRRLINLSLNLATFLNLAMAFSLKEWLDCSEYYNH